MVADANSLKKEKASTRPIFTPCRIRNLIWKEADWTGSPTQSLFILLSQRASGPTA